MSDANAGVQRARYELGERLATLVLADYPVADRVKEYVRDVVAVHTPPFHVDALTYQDGEWLYLLSASGVDLFGAMPPGASESSELRATFRRRSFGPLHGATYDEEVSVFAPGGQAATARIRHGDLVFEIRAKSAKDYEALAPVFELLRRWARSPAPATN